MPLKRVELTTTVPMWGAVEHVFYAERLELSPVALALYTRDGVVCLGCPSITRLTVGPTPHPDHHGCAVCPVDQPCTHLEALRSSNDYDGGPQAGGGE